MDAACSLGILRGRPYGGVGVLIMGVPVGHFRQYQYLLFTNTSQYRYFNVGWLRAIYSSGGSVGV